MIFSYVFCSAYVVKRGHCFFFAVLKMNFLVNAEKISFDFFNIKNK